MYQIDDDQAVADKPVLPTDRIGSPGWFTGGLAALGIKATRVRAYWLNMIQAEIMAVVAAAGIALAKGTDNQLLLAIKTLIGRSSTHMSLFVSNGTWFAPAGDTMGLVLVVGGGGGGSNCAGGSTAETGSNFGGGGGAGGAALALFSIAAGSTAAVTVGAGGLPQYPGGTTSFGAVCAASGGGGSLFQGVGGVTFSAGGAPGIATLGTNVTGVLLAGGYGCDGQAGSDNFAGNGGASILGGGGRAGSQGGMNGQAYGSGGGGAYDHARSGNTYIGGTGAPGVVIILSWGPNL